MLTVYIPLLNHLSKMTNILIRILCFNITSIVKFQWICSPNYYISKRRRAMKYEKPVLMIWNEMEENWGYRNWTFGIHWIQFSLKSQPSWMYRVCILCLQSMWYISVAGCLIKIWDIFVAFLSIAYTNCIAWALHQTDQIEWSFVCQIHKLQREIQKPIRILSIKRKSQKVSHRRPPWNLKI